MDSDLPSYWDRGREKRGCKTIFFFSWDAFNLLKKDILMFGKDKSITVGRHLTNRVCRITHRSLSEFSLYCYLLKYTKPVAAPVDDNGEWQIRSSIYHQYDKNISGTCVWLIPCCRIGLHTFHTFFLVYMECSYVCSQNNAKVPELEATSALQEHLCLLLGMHLALVLTYCCG